MAEHGIKCEILAQLLREKDIGVNQLARETGIARSSISSYSSYSQEYADINSNNLIKLAKYFNVSCDYLLGLTPVRSIAQDLRNAADLLLFNETTIDNIRIGVSMAKFENEDNDAYNRFFSDGQSVYNFMHNIGQYVKIADKIYELKKNTEDFGYATEWQFHNALVEQIDAKDLAEYRVLTAVKKMLHEAEKK